jgi:hypothetical protein
MPRLVVDKAPSHHSERLVDFLAWLALSWPPTRTVHVHFLNKPVGDGGFEAPYAITEGGSMLYVAAAQPGASWVAIAASAAEAYASVVRFAPDRRLWAKRAVLRYREERGL